MVSLKSLTLLVTKDSENHSKVLSDQFASSDLSGKSESPFALETIKIFNTEPGFLVKFDENIVQFIKSQSETLQNLAIFKMEINSENTLLLLNS